MITSTTTYCNEDGEDFALNQSNGVGDNKCLQFEIIRGSNAFYFLNLTEVDEFIDLLRLRAEEVFLGVQQ